LKFFIGVIWHLSYPFSVVRVYLVCFFVYMINISQLKNKSQVFSKTFLKYKNTMYA
jgi:hypothetical protein